MTKKPRKRPRKKRYHTGVYVSTKTGQHCKYRSGWELKYLVWLDSDPNVIDFGYEALKIPYVSNLRTGKLRNYLPDFFVKYFDGTSQVVEIKPKRKVMQATVQKKLKAAEGWCKANGSTLVILTEVDLKALGLM